MTNHFALCFDISTSQPMFFFFGDLLPKNAIAKKVL
jgi:hypothetical protein